MFYATGQVGGSLGSIHESINQIKSARKINPNYEPLQLPKLKTEEREKEQKEYSIWLVIGAFFLGTFF